MRAFIGLTSSDLELPLLPTRGLLITGMEEGLDPQRLRGEELEVAEFNTTVDASLVSLERVRDQLPNCAACRIVAAIEVDGVARDLESDAGELPWSQVEAFLVDEADAEPAVTQACQAQTQVEADEAVAQILDHPLAWWDGSERPDLIEALS